MSLASRYYQLLSGHAAIGSFLHERMMGPLHLESDRYRWRNSAARESRHHLFVKYRAWTVQRHRLWRRVGKDCGWEHARAPAVRTLWAEGATEVVLEFLEDTHVGYWAAAGTARRQAEDVGQTALPPLYVRENHIASFKRKRRGEEVVSNSLVCQCVIATRLHAPNDIYNNFRKNELDYGF